jgi:uncharacterized membrane protein
MAPAKVVLLVAGIALIAVGGGVFGPGPLVPGLGPAFDQIGIVIALIVLAVATIPWVIRTMRKSGHRRDSTPTDRAAEEILRERYAQGELDRAQFLFMLDDLRAPHSRKP